MSQTFLVLICGTDATDHAVALGVTGLLTKPSLRILKMPAPTERLRVPSPAALILDP